MKVYCKKCKYYYEKYGDDFGIGGGYFCCHPLNWFPSKDKEESWLSDKKWVERGKPWILNKKNDCQWWENRRWYHIFSRFYYKIK